MPRSADELLEQVYRRVHDKRRRRVAGVTASSATFALVAAVIAMTQLTGTIVPPRPVVPEAGKPRRSQITRPVTPPAQPPAQGGCSCLTNPTRRPATRPGPGRPPAPQEREGYVLAFASDRDGDYDIYTMRADGSGVRQITNDPAPERDPEWSPDGKHLAFVRLHDAAEEIGTVYVANADGSNARRIADGLSPKWSPDGRMLAYHTHPIVYGESYGGVWVINADGSGRRLVVQDAGDPTWAPDGRRLVTGMRINGAVNVYVVSLDGTSRTQLTRDPAYACEPEVSPDGSAIAYVSSLPTRLQVMRFDGSNARAITAGAGWEFGPSWSPDGAFIAFERDADSDLHYMGALGTAVGPAKPQIVIARADGSGEVVVPSDGHSYADPAFAPARR